MNQYEIFYQLHHQSRPFILANAWNVKSAQLIEKAGFAAIGTSSGAIAETLGYPDGEKIPFEALLYIVQRIKASTTIPLTVDMERGYSNDLDKLNDNIQKLIDCGVAGINLEDAEGEDIYLKKLSSIKNYLDKTNQQFFINARTDIYIQKLSSPLDTVIKRANLYKEAGAGGLFVPGISDTEAIKQITGSTTLPVNIAATPSLNDMQAITAAGIKRISMAVFLYRNVYRQLDKIAASIKETNNLQQLF